MSQVSSLTDIVRWVIAAPLLLIWLIFALINLRILLRNFSMGLNAGPAPVTIVGGLAGCIGLLIVPYLAIGDRLPWLWVPLLLDWGSAPFYLSMLVVGIWQHLSTNAWQHYWYPGKFKTKS